MAIKRTYHRICPECKEQVLHRETEHTINWLPCKCDQRVPGPPDPPKTFMKKDIIIVELNHCGDWDCVTGLNLDGVCRCDCQQCGLARMYDLGKKAREELDERAFRVLEDYGWHRKLQEAWMIGAYAAGINSVKRSDNPYSLGSPWRWAWYSGFEIERVIEEAFKKGAETMHKKLIRDMKEYMEDSINKS